MRSKHEFRSALTNFSQSLSRSVSDSTGQWAIKGFIDIYKNIYAISSDTKLVSKILEIHLLPKVLQFAEQNGFAVVLPEHQNYYPDLSFVAKDKQSTKYAVDFKTTYRLPNKPWLCNGFTLGSHGRYFKDRRSTKNIQFAYGEYSGHFCLGAIYQRTCKSLSEGTAAHQLADLRSIASAISNIQFFVAEKWRIASDRRGSGNTANIGSI